MILLILFAFLAGIITILSPCILPVLPIVLSGSVGGGKRKPVGIVLGFIFSFTFFTLALTSLVRATGVSAELLRYIAVGVIFVLGVSLFLPQTQVLLEKLVAKLATFLPSNASNKTGFFTGLLVGVSLGLIWTPCVGPILASVITLAVTSQVSFAAVFITLAYALGTGLPMLAIMYGGKRILDSQPWLTSHTAQIQRGFGIVMILVAVGLYFGVERRFQTAILSAFPKYGAGLTQLEDTNLVQQQLNKLRGEEENQVVRATLLPPQQKAPGFSEGTQWIGTEPLSLEEDLKGKVVLVDFWTYSCINCIRTFPYLTSWYEKYKDEGFVIVGVHAPEFAFEKNAVNVEKAMQDFGITYPVVQDNDFRIWEAYNNQYWPAHYLIDKDGFIRYTHFGEGEYDKTENAIRELLGEQPLPAASQETSLFNRGVSQTPETYLGYSRAQSYSSQNKIQIDTQQTYDFSLPIPQDAVALKGSWIVGKESITAGAFGSQLALDFKAGKVHLVLAPANTGSGKVQVLLDGKPLPGEYYTEDMNEEGFIPVTEPRKYDILDLQGKSENHVLSLIFTEGVQAFAFTFGE